jgi:hypothetical protein
VSRRRRRAEAGAAPAGGPRPEAGAARARPEAGAARARPEPGAARDGRADAVAPAAPAAPGRGPYRIRPRYQVAILIAVFAVVTLIAELAGAVNLGVALGIGQIAFGVALVVVLLRS